MHDTQLLSLVRELAVELGRPRAVDVTLDTSFQDELGIDSLGRLELLVRAQQRFQVSLPDELALKARTTRELLAAIGEAPPARRAARPATAAPEPALIEIPRAAESLPEVLCWHAEQTPSRVHLTLLDGEASRDITYGELLLRAREAAQRLRTFGVCAGDRVALMLPTCEAYFESFFGILLAGAIPVPIYPPARWDMLDDHMRRQSAILANAGARTLITQRSAEGIAALLEPRVESLEEIVTAEDLLSHPGSEIELPAVGADDVGLLQYTSGSTGDPKGVVLSHRNILANVRAIGYVQQVMPEDVTVSWLPLYHDMGLIGAWFVSLYHGCRLIVMSPLAFLVHPERWLWAIHEYRGTLSPAPNFAYEICASRLDDGSLEGLDLSSWRVALNGAEPVSPRTLTRFTERFSRYGFRPEALAPVYGLAENSVALTLPRPDTRPRIDAVDRAVLSEKHLAEPVAANSHHAVRVIACGFPIPEHGVRVVGDNGTTLGERRQGRVQFRGPSATTGYFRNPAATARLFDDGWLETGDLGYLADGELFITGRAKDVIIRAGRNIHPHEVEEAIGRIDGVRKGCIAVFGSADEARGTERLVVAAEIRGREVKQRTALLDQVAEAARPLTDGLPDDIVLLPPRSIPKTSSGKIRRDACRRLYEQGRLGTRRQPWRRLPTLLLAGLTTGLRAFRRATGEYLYAAYGVVLANTWKPATWLLVMCTPGVARRRRMLGRSSRVFLWLARIPVTVTGREHLLERPCMAVANHQSFLDTIVLNSIVPETFFFTPKGDLADDPVAGPFLRRIGAQFVDRLDPATGVADLEPVKERLRAGESAVVYPEGVFYPEPGLRHFYMGGFQVAARASVPVVPVAIRGARSIWRGETMLPFFRRGAVEVKITESIEPGGRDWQAAVALRREVKQRILEHSGEFDACG